MNETADNAGSGLARGQLDRLAALVDSIDRIMPTYMADPERDAWTQDDIDDALAVSRARDDDAAAL